MLIACSKRIKIIYLKTLSLDYHYLKCRRLKNCYPNDLNEVYIFCTNYETIIFEFKLMCFVPQSCEKN